MVSHVRFASSGSIRVENTHPWLYHNWVFAHNGTIRDKRALLELLHEKYRNLEGDTDSEVFFHLIVQEVKELGDPIEGIMSAIEKVVNKGVDFSSFNFIASNGENLYALRYATTKPKYYTLYYIERPKEGFELRKLSKETQQLIATKLAHGEKAIIIASEPMSDEQYWKLIQNKHLAIVNKSLNIELKKLNI